MGMHPNLRELEGFIFNRSFILRVGHDKQRVESLFPGDYIAVMYETLSVVGRVEWHARCEDAHVIVLWLHDGNYTHQLAIAVAPGDRDYGETWIGMRRQQHNND